VTLKKTYEANQVQIQIRAIEGWIAFEKGNRENGLTRMAEAAAMEEATEKHPVTPGEVIPARELYGDMLMEAGQFEKALEAYEMDIKRHPGRFNGLSGAARAARKSGMREKAMRYYEQLATLARRGDIGRRSLVHDGLLMTEKNVPL
jgi:tetratricopeptide (TPR) repeat protein